MRGRRPRVVPVLLALMLAVSAGGARAQEATPSAAGDRVSAIIEGMSLRQKVGQLFMSRVYGERADSPPGAAQQANRRDLGVDDARALVERYHVGSIVYFEWAGNLRSADKTAQLSRGIQRAARDAGIPPVLISTDQEQGVVRRLGPPATQLPGAMALGATRDPGLAREAARVTGEELRAVGIRQNLAPVADVNTNPANPVIGIRSFGSRPSLVSAMVAEQVRGLQDDAGVAATVKHFPGHGDTNIDSHTSLPTIRHSLDTWWAVDAVPFEAAIDAGTEVVMTAHIAMPALDPSRRPATLSHPILTGILREQMGFEGVIMTDSLTMAAVRARYGDRRVPVLALKAGADVLADPPQLPRAYRAVLAAVASGEISEERIDESVARVLRLKQRLGLLDEPADDPAAGDPTTSLGSEPNQDVARAVGEASVTVLRLRPERRLPVPKPWSILLTGWDDDGVRTLAAALRDAGRSVETRWTGAMPTRRERARATRAQRRHDITVVVTAYLGADRQQRRLVDQLLRGGRTIIVSVRSPYDVGWFPSAPVQVVTYGSAPASMQALARIIEGELAPTGRSPVRIPYLGRPGTLFPFGSGVSWESP